MTERNQSSADSAPCTASGRNALLYAALVLAVGSVVCGPSSLASDGDTKASEDLESRARTPHHHLISLYNEDGEIISPGDEPAVPYSPSRTCGKCHDYTRVQMGWHFNAATAGVDAGRPAQPWVLADPDTVSQVPVSYRSWPGVFRPRDLGMTAWEFLHRFGRHLPGNIDAKTDGNSPDPEARWEISGGLEIDCLACHSADGSHDQAARAAQVKRENYKWAPTACSGLATVRGDASKLPEDFDPFMPPDPDHPEQQPPSIAYDKTRFNSDDRVHLAITRRPSPDRCYFCHTNREVGAEAPHDWNVDPDVHLASGLACTDCHRNGLDHNIVRGFEGEPLSKTHPEVASLTCRGCHLGNGAHAPGRPGRLGAPRPRHLGLPAFHLEELSCTACHSGLRPTAGTRHIQTSRAHALGIARKGRRDDALPWIVEPVFLRDPAGQIRPYRVFWPAWWGRMKDGRAVPLDPEQVRDCVPDRPKRKSHAMQDVWTPFTRERIHHVLAALAEKDEDAGEPVYLCAGRLYRLQGDRVVDEPFTSGSVCSWPVAHDVRPEGRALGARGCAECHAPNSSFFFGAIDVRPTVEGSPLQVQRIRLLGENPALMRAWANVLAFRDAILAACGLSAFIVLATLVRYAFLGLAGIPRKPC